MSCRTGPLRVGRRPLGGGYTFLAGMICFGPPVGRKMIAVYVLGIRADVSVTKVQDAALGDPVMRVGREWREKCTIFCSTNLYLT